MLASLLGLVWLVTAWAGAQDMSLLLRQAADGLLLNSLPGLGPKPTAAARLPGRGAQPSPADLSIRRLQVALALLTEDDWRDLTDPQRWAILQSQGATEHILRSFTSLTANISQLEAELSVGQVEAQLNDPRISPPAAIRAWDALKKYLGPVGQMYPYFRGYVRDPGSAASQSLLDFASLVTQNDSSVERMLADFHAAVQSVENKSGPSVNVFKFFRNRLEENGEHLCSMSQSPHQLMYNLYNIIALTEVKGYAMVQFSYMMLRIYNKGNYTREAEVAKNKFEKDATEKLRSVREVLPALSRQLMRCDPPEHKEGTTFLQVKRFMQGYIENEVDMNERGTCNSQCSEYTYAESKGCFKNLFCSKQPQCKGRIFDCQFYHADAWVCMSQDPDRRYDWVEYEDGTMLGQKEQDQCINKIKVDSWWRYVFWHCSYCLCKCDEITPESERYWSLLPSVADTTRNMVVVAARLVKRKGVFHIQIQQARALPEGGVDESTKSWLEPQQISDTNLTASQLVFTMSYEQRALDLDTLSAPENHVLTGLRFRNIGGHINLEIQVTPIQFGRGQLIADRSTWIANDNTPASGRPRQMLPIISPDVPTRLLGLNKVDSKHDQYLQFDTTSALKDVSQTTVPFLDAQTVSPAPSTWLAGAGLYHKGRIGYGGFVGLSLETYDFSRHLLPDTPLTNKKQV